MSKPPKAPVVQGLPLHTRSLTVAVKRGEGSLWHARGDVIDLRKNGVVPSNYDLQPSGVIHMMSIELDFDPDSLRIDAVRVDQPFVAVEASAATGGECCRDPAPRLLALAGEPLDEGFTKTLGQAFGGALGCSHLLTLFQLMASAVPTGVRLEHARVEREGTRHEPSERFYRRSVFVDGFEANRAETQVAVQLADTHARPLGPGERATERLALSHEVKTFVSVDRKRFLIDRLDLRERRRSAQSVARAEWQDHGALVAPLVGVRVIPGLAGRVFALLGEAPERRAVRDNLLQLAPGFIQIMAAQMDEHLEGHAPSREGGGKAKPAVANLGGNPDSCYMWRRDGPIRKAAFVGEPLD